MKKIISKVCDVLLIKPFITLTIITIITVFAFLLASKLTINSNQIDLLPDSFTEVSKVKRVIEMIGGNGFFIICMKYKDEKGRDIHLKQAYAAKQKGDMELFSKEMDLAEEVKNKNNVYYKEKELLLKKNADALSDRLLKEKTVRYTSYRHDTTFLKDRFPLFLHPEDMKEAGKRLKRKIDEEVERANPFYIQLSNEQYNPDFKDIISKYQKLAKRDIFDDYNISPDKGMLLLLVKPGGSFQDIEFIRNFEVRVNDIVQEMALKDKGLLIGYTGTYKLNLDDYDSLVNALKPVSIASLLGISILLLIFFRNPLFIIIQLISLIIGVILTFGTTYLVIGRLNNITSIMAAILMGLGIDYGIQFIYRFREEFSKTDDLLFSVKETIYHTGMASLSSALTTTSAFVILMFSQFRGFSEFGLIACYGIILIALSMYFTTAVQIAVILRLFPSSRKLFYLNEKQKTVSPFVKKLFAKPGLMLIISSVAITVVSVFALKVQFNYSGRDLLLEYQESLLLYDEIGDRFDISSDPQVIVVDTLEESEAVYDYFTPLPVGMESSVDQVVSLWNFVPPVYQQIENRKLLNVIDKDIKRVKPTFLKPDQKKYLPIVKKYMEVKIFSYKDVPKYFFDQFTEVPTSKIKGYMLFIYPKIALWHGKDLFRFHALVSEFKYPKISRRTLNSILYHAQTNRFSNEFNPKNESYTKQEKTILLKALNTYSFGDLEKLQILPGTAKFIIEKRPFQSIEEVKSYTNTGNTAGSLILFARLAKIVQSEGFTTFLATICLVTVILIAFFRGIVPAILSLFPLLLGILVMLGIMGITGQKINFMNILVFPIVIGYGIQNGIYIFFRFQEEKNIAQAMSKVGPAITASTLTTLVGWSVLLLAEHRGLHSLGVVASIGIGSSLLVAFTLLPSLLAIVYRKRHIEEVIGSTIHGERTLELILDEKKPVSNQHPINRKLSENKKEKKPGKEAVSPDLKKPGKKKK